MPYKHAMFGLKIALPILICVVSFFIVSNYVSTSKFTTDTIESLDESKDKVMKLAASSTAVSVAITTIPGDVATPVAEKLSDLSIGFLIVIMAIYIEKFLVAITGLVVFRWLVPIACIAYIVGVLFRKQWFKEVSYKIGVLALAIFLLVPVSTKISESIEKSFGETIDQTIDAAETSAELIQESVEPDATAEEANNGLAKVIKSLEKAGESIANGSSEFMKYIERLFNRFLEALALLLVTCCVIPVLVLLVIFYIVKLLFAPGVSVNFRRPFVPMFENKNGAVHADVQCPYVQKNDNREDK